MSVVDEGFICPYCLVGFATSGKLQSHFVEMHSGSETTLGWDGEDGEHVGATGGYEQLGTEEECVDGVLGHQFVQRRMQKPSSCSACEEIIWQDGIACQGCPVVIHIDGCRAQLTVPCTTSEKPEVTQENGVQRSSGPQQPPKGPLALVRRQIAKGRDRFVDEEFDLDLTYITERIIAMSFPATGMQSAYRNSLKDVAKMLKTKHQESYMIFNLSERSYDISRFNNQVLDFGWPDHLAPSLERLSSVCRSMKSWLDSDPQHVVVVHCKGGKGRTGCVIASFMNYSEICQSAEAALDRFAMKRFYDSKCVGVTQPSQRKYVHFFSDLLTGNISLKTPPVVLNHVIIHGVPNYDGKGGCRVFLKIYVNMKLEHTSGLYVSNGENERIKITLHGGGLTLQGEVLLKCFHKKSHSGMDCVFRCQFHTAIVRDTLRLVLKKEDLDDAFRDKKFPENSKVEMLFENDGEISHGAGLREDVDLRTSLLPESNGTADLTKYESLYKRDSYANFEGGYDSGAPDRVPDLISFSPTSPHQDIKQSSSKQQRNRTESTDSYNMDPQAIERVAKPGSDHVYTVVNKSAPGIKAKFQISSQDPSPAVSRGRTTDPPYVNQSCIPSHPQHDRPIVYRKSTKTKNKTKDSEVIKQVKGHLESDGPASKKKAYDEIAADQLMKLQPVTPRHSGYDSDAGWCKFKFQTLPSKGDTGHRSSSSSNPTLGSNSGDMYSNLGDLYVGGAFVGESQRRHSFAEGDELIVIRGNGTRDSIIPVASGGSRGDGDYNNVGLSVSNEDRSRLTTVTGKEEALYINPEMVIAALNLEVKGHQKRSGGGYYNVPMPNRDSVVPLPKVGGIVPPQASSLSGLAIDDEDYMNEIPEGVFHTYSNHKELLEQLQAGNNPVPEPVLQSAESASLQGQENKISAIFKNFISKTPFVKKSHSEIHSQTITDTDRQKTLQPFALTGNAQPGRDYEAFFKASAWGATGNKSSERHKPDVPPDKPSVRPDRPRMPADNSRGKQTDKQHVSSDTTNGSERKIFPATDTSNDTRTPTPAMHILTQGPHSPQLPSRRPLRSHSPLETKLSIPTPHSNPPPLGGGGSAAAPTVKSVSPSSSPRGHRRVGQARSVDQPSQNIDARDNRPTSHVPRPNPPQPEPAPEHSERTNRGMGGARGRLPPPRPPPYISQPGERNHNVPSESKVRSLMPYWYRPNITREEAIGLVRQMDSGAFIVRDSQTVSGGYALTIKVAEAIVRQRKKLGDGAKVTEDMCVTHFLIQPDPEGVKLQGWNERAFKSLAEFIAHHTVDKLCLPCKLVLPKSGSGVSSSEGGVRGRATGASSSGGGGGSDFGRGRGGDVGDGSGSHQVRRRPVTMQEALKTGAACDLVYLGSLDVAGPGSEVELAQTVQQMKSLDVSVSVVTFKAAKEGITISGNVSGLYIKRQYPISSLTYCGADPNDTRWDFPQLQHLGDSISINNAPCFGVFTRLPESGGHSCLLFAQYSTSQPVTSVLSYLHQVMRQRRHNN